MPKRSKADATPCRWINGPQAFKEFATHEGKTQSAIPLIDAENLFRQPGPRQFSTRRDFGGECAPPEHCDACFQTECGPHAHRSAIS
jgi:hypothetical protein